MEQSVGWINFNLNRLYKYVQTIFLEKTGKNIHYLLTWYVYRYIVIPTTTKEQKENRSEEHYI